MFKKTMVGALAALGVMFASAASASTIAEIGDSTYKLYDKAGDAFCSAVAIDERILITANHCVQAGENIRILTYDSSLNVIAEKVLYVKALRTLVGKDVAILEVLDPEFKFDTFVDIASNEEANAVEFGDDVIAIGYPAVLDLTVTEGLFGQLIKSPAPNMWEGFLYRFTAPIIGGNSGGGLYAMVDGEWKLIGVTVGGYNTNGAFMNVATPIESIEAVVSGFLEAKLEEQMAAEADIPGTGIDAR